MTKPLSSYNPPSLGPPPLYPYSTLCTILFPPSSRSCSLSCPVPIRPLSIHHVMFPTLSLVWLSLSIACMPVCQSATTSHSPPGVVSSLRLELYVSVQSSNKPLLCRVLVHTYYYSAWGKNTTQINLRIIHNAIFDQIAHATAIGLSFPQSET